MTIITPTYILGSQKIIKDHSIVYDKNIIDIDLSDSILKKYPNAKHIKLKKNSLVMPGLINPHVHLEFSANQTSLEYGSFIPWLNSVIANRDELINACTTDCLEKTIQKMLSRGITTIGAVSSYGLDFEALFKSKQKTVIFNELIGSNPAMADGLWADFQARLNESMINKSDTIIPAIAIHSPYSVYPLLVEKAIALAKKHQLPLSTHLLESKAERDWLDKSEGEFVPFFNDLLKQKKAVCTPLEFIQQFNNYPTLFTHGIELNNNELEQILKHKHTIIHSPISNRLLGNGRLAVEKLREKKIPWILGTDGLSSNYKLDLFEEMKIALFIHFKAPLALFAKLLINNATINSAKALGLNTGSIEKNKNADMVALELSFDIKERQMENFYYHLILHDKKITHTIINGEIIYESN
jgi:cytosine/adenosine deaminase-related metal-dependent hydrolase